MYAKLKTVVLFLKISTDIYEPRTQYGVVRHQSPSSSNRVQGSDYSVRTTLEMTELKRNENNNNNNNNNTNTADLPKGFESFLYVVQNLKVFCPHPRCFM